MQKKALVTAITNQKGGVLKSTTAENLGSAESGSENLTFSFNALSLTDESGTVISAEGLNVVVFEELFDVSRKLIEDHKDISDEGQTIHFPSGSTTAVDKENGTHNRNSIIQ